MELENKYNHAVKLLADAYRYRLNGENFEFKSSLNDAGENFSQVIELAVKQHLASKDNKIWECYKRTPFPKTIFDNYVSEDGDKGDFYYDTIAEVDSDVDFEFLASNKNKLTNRSKHGGIDVDESVVERYRLEIKKFLHDYIDENACLKNIDDFLKPENDDISNFYNACDMFHYEDRTFVLITDEKNVHIIVILER